MDPALCSFSVAMAAVPLVGRLFDGPIDIVADIHGAAQPYLAKWFLVKWYSSTAYLGCLGGAAHEQRTSVLILPRNAGH